MGIKETIELNESLLLKIIGTATNKYNNPADGWNKLDTNNFYEMIDWAFQARRILADLGKETSSPLFDRDNWWTCKECQGESLDIHSHCHYCSCEEEYEPVADYYEDLNMLQGGVE